VSRLILTINNDRFSVLYLLVVLMEASTFLWGTKINFNIKKPWRSSGGESPTSHRGILGSVTVRSMWDL